MNVDLRDEYPQLLKLTLTGLADVQPTRYKLDADDNLDVIPLWNR